VPLHSHADPETFNGVSGELSALDGDAWVRVGPGEIFHVPGGVPHAWRNDGDVPAVTTIVTTARRARFFRELAGPDALEVVSARYGFWNATAEENAAIGLT